MKPRVSLLVVDDVAIDVVRKAVKNLSLRVYPPDGHVRITAPLRATDAAISAFARSKAAWIARHQQRVRARTAASARDYVSGERHDVWGDPLVLTVALRAGRPRAQIVDGILALSVRPGTDADGRRTVIERLHRALVQDRGSALLAVWEPVVGVRSSGLSVRQMKTRWGSCSPHTGTIRLNAALAMKPPECLEYVVVHELAHLLERSHGPRFVALMNRFLPDWKQRRALLNRGGIDRPPCG